MTKGGKPYSSMEKDGKWKTMGRVYPYSAHDNRAALQDTINPFDDGLGRKKCLDERRQHNSHFCICHHGSVSSVEETKGDFSTYQTDYQDSQDTESTTSRRFPRNHLGRSTVAAAAQAGEHFMWFGRHDSDCTVPLEVLAATNCSTSSSKPTKYSYHSKSE